MKQLIMKEILSIKNLQERIILKELMEQVFLPIYENNMELYQQLEERIKGELTYDVNRYLINTGLIEKKDLAVKHPFMTVMRVEDQEQSSLTVKNIRESIKAEGRCFLGTVFLKSDVLKLRQLLEDHHHTQGIIRTNQEHKIEVSLEQNKSYLSEVERLYHLFRINSIPWKTVTCPYLFKLVDVYVTDISAQCQDSETVESYRINLGELTSSICYDVMPIWNVWHLKLDSINFPVCHDQENYEHMIDISDYGEDHIYLVDDQCKSSVVSKNGSQLLITNQLEQVKEWDVYSIRSIDEKADITFKYPVMGNFRSDGFTERLQQRYGQSIKTRGELSRFIKGFCLERYLKYEDCLLREYIDEPEETYAVNFFIIDEIRTDKKDKQLMLLFQAAKGAGWLARDLMSFIVSEVQELYPEYHCIGKLRDEEKEYEIL